MSRPAGLRVVASPEALARAAAELVLEHARDALAARGVFHLALAGGVTPREAYRELARRGPEAGFERWHAWFGDERAVAPEDPASNFRLVAGSGLLARLREENIHRLRGEAPDLAAEAARYARELSSALGEPPRLDLVLLGLGTDGHTASLFPATPALAGWVAVGRAPRPPEARLTLTFATLSEARAVLFLVAGADKSEVLAEALRGAPRLPAAQVRPRSGTLTWLVERSALAQDGAGGVAVEGFEPPTRGL